MRQIFLVVTILLIGQNLGWSASQVEDRLYELADDPDPRVRFQLAFTLGELSGPQKIEALRKIAIRDSGDRWTRTAILSSVNDDAIQLFEALLAFPDKEGLNRGHGFIRELAKVLGTQAAAEEIAAALDGIAEVHSDVEPPVVASTLTGLAEGIELSGNKGIELAGQEESLTLLLNDPDTSIQAAAQRLAEFVATGAVLHTEESIAEAIQSARDSSVSAEERRLALESLGGADISGHSGSLTDLTTGLLPDEVALAALDTLESLSDPSFTDAVLSRFLEMAPAVKERAFDSVFSRTGRLMPLLGAIQAGELDKKWIDRERRPQILLSPNEEVSGLSKAIYGELEMGEDSSLFEAYRAAIDIPGDPEKGHETYRTRCVFCHKVGDEGVNLGPDWSAVKNNTREALLANILYPNRDIDPGFLNYVVETTDGELVTGILVSSGEASLTFRRALGEEDTVLRRNIATLRNTELSIMPTGLEAGLSVEQVADLLAFIQSIQ